MADTTKLLLTLWAHWLIRRTRLQLRGRRRPDRAQHQTLRTLLEPLSQTVRGRQLRITPQLTPAAFRQEVPLSDYATLAPWVDRVRGGEADVLWPGTSNVFTATAGTTTGRPRLIPVTEAMTKHFLDSVRRTLLEACARMGKVDPIRGRVLVLGGNMLARQAGFPVPADPSDPLIADLATLALQQKPDWVRRHFLEPTARIARETDWTTYVERVLRRTRTRDITTIVGQPQWLAVFAETVLAQLAQGKVRYTSLQAVWPDLRCAVLTGDSADAQFSDLRRLLGAQVQIQEVFAAAEGVYAAQGFGQHPGLRLRFDAGIYFEFLPLDLLDRTPLAELGPAALPIEAVQPGEDYALVVTTPAGLVRHVVGDIVRFTHIKPPRLVPRGQLDLRLRRFGENLLSHDLQQILIELCRARKWQLSHFHVAPLSAMADFGQVRGCHEWWIELRAGTRETPTGPVMALEIDRRLRRSHAGYAASRERGQLEMPIVRLVMPGVFAHWLKHVGQWGGSFKLPACRNDRRIADDLAQMARFSRD